MISLRERCLFLTCKCNPSAVHFAVGTMSPPPPPPPLALTKWNAVHLLRMSRRTCLAHVVCFACRAGCIAQLSYSQLSFSFSRQWQVYSFLGLKIFTELSPIIFNLSLQVKDLSRSKCTLWCKLCFTATLLDKISFFMKQEEGNNIGAARNHSEAGMERTCLTSKESQLVRFHHDDRKGS